MKDWLIYEKEYTSKGYKVICGVDEAGRGPLAGPVYAGAVILKNGEIIDGADDSKKLSEKKRENIYEEIKSRAVSWSIGCCSEKEIDEMNILNATYLSMQRAVSNLGIVPDMILVDGNKIPDFKIPSKAIVKGDSICMSIACASIVAKVERDRYMKELDIMYPDYGFAKHKGYGTKSHIEKIKQYGASPVHRLSFLKKILG